MDKQSTSNVNYQPIGTVQSIFDEHLPPEILRAAESRLALESRFAPAVAALEIGKYLWVIYHLHEAEPWQDRYMPELFTRRIACRPNTFGITLTRIVSLDGSIISVVGLDAVNGSPILDIKPYKPIFDEPPVTPEEDVI